MNIHMLCLKLVGTAYLWNPTTKQAKHVPFSYSPRDYDSSSIIGFGFNPLSSDYEVVRIFYAGISVRPVQVYSANTADSWIEIQVEELSLGESHVLIKTIV